MLKRDEFYLDSSHSLCGVLIHKVAPFDEGTKISVPVFETCAIHPAVTEKRVSHACCFRFTCVSCSDCWRLVQSYTNKFVTSVSVIFEMFVLIPVNLEEG